MSLIIANSVISHPYGLVIQRVCDFLKRSWVFEVHHAFREANRFADALAALGHLHQSGVVFYELPPIFFGFILARGFGWCSHSSFDCIVFFACLGFCPDNLSKKKKV